MTMLEKYNIDHCNPASHLKHVSMVVICEIDCVEFFRCNVEHEWLYASSDTNNLKNNCKYASTSSFLHHCIYQKLTHL